MNTVKTRKKQQEVYGIITEMSQVILFLVILNLLNIKASVTGNTYNVDAGEAGYDANKVGKNETETVIPLKHLSNI